MLSTESRRRARKTNQKRIALIGLFFVVVLTLNFFNINPFGRVTEAIARPIWGTQSFLQEEIVDFRNVLKSKKALVVENNSLRQEKEERRHIELQLALLEQENSELRHLLGRNDEVQKVLAKVLNRPLTSPYDTIIIDLGTSNGIHVGDQVIALGDFAIGEISRVSPNTAQVTLYSSPGERSNVFIGPERIAGVAEGRGAGNFRASLPRDAELAIGDSVVLEQNETQVFGVVEAISRDAADAFQLVLFKNPVNIFSIRYVEVIRSQNTI